MRAAFFGTPAIAIPALRALSSVATIVGVVSQPDRPQGRGLRVQPSAIKLEAEALGLEINQPAAVRDGKLEAWLRERETDFALVMAYGRILPAQVLSAPRLGCLNLHASLLPKYRGAAPIQWAIANGESETGISLMQMDVGLDTGPVYSEHSLELTHGETAGSLRDRLALLAAKVVLRALPRALDGSDKAAPQDELAATLAPPIREEHTWLSFDQAPEHIERWVRALTPRPLAQTRLRDQRLKVLRVELTELPSVGLPGTLEVRKNDVLVATAGTALRLLEVQLEGRRAMSAVALANGRGIAHGERLHSGLPEAS